MLKVIATGKINYKGITREPYQEFLIDDKDKEMMIKFGCIVIEEKVINPRKVEPKQEVKEATFDTVETFETEKKKGKKD